jgi:sugar phosphate isomerase/epimerase
MLLQFLCTYWGQESLGAIPFLNKVIDEGYDGIEINPPADDAFISNLLNRISEIKQERPFVFVGQQVLAPADESFTSYRERFIHQLNFLCALKPDFINSHTGKDYYSFEKNCELIEIAGTVSRESGIPIIHETHRGRFSFHAASILPYLSKYPQLQLAGDLSHWCTVSESLLADQADIIKKIIPHINHIHARVGYEHGPQVNDPRAPEWTNHVNAFIEFWKSILRYHKETGEKNFTILTEFGPEPYMPTAPFSNIPLGDQWQINAWMKDLLKKELVV